jgi:hypothetical protein
MGTRLNLEKDKIYSDAPEQPTKKIKYQEIYSDV